MLMQPVLFESPDPVPAREADCCVESVKARGAVYTKPSVIEFMLDLIGYTSNRPLWEWRLLEPSFGAGGFLFAVVGRLIQAWRAANPAGDDSMLDDAIRAVELDAITFDQTQGLLVAKLIEGGMPELSAARLAKRWLVNDDFLGRDLDGSFDFVVGNPPYVRQEMIPDALLARYRATYRTMVGRSDLYVPFFEKGLSLLRPGGKLSFICADAWTKNDYGRTLRELVTQRFGLLTYVDMYGLDAFEDSVGTYPSITVIGRGRNAGTRTATATSIEREYLTGLAEDLASPAATVPPVVLPRGGAPWLLQPDGQQAVIRELEARFETLERVGCRVGIGVATGADKVFVGEFSALDVEPSRKLPLSVNKDVCQGNFTWGGMGVVNPWSDDGGLVDLAAFPKLAAYLVPHREVLSRRHTAKGDPDRRWYKTIDRIKPALTWQPKLLVPDIRGDGDAISYDAGHAYPHHNLYYITSATWDLQALQALLRSGVASLFIDAYAVRIGGGYLRFQAQYLRRIRLPRWDDVEAGVRQALMDAGRAGAKVPGALVERVYGMSAGAMTFVDDREQQ